MLTYAARRIGQSVIVCLMTTLLVFFGIMQVGDPLELLVTDDCDTRCRMLARQQLGLDRPLVDQYFIFLQNIFSGNLGRSFVFGTPVGQLLLERLPATLELAFAALVFVVGIGLPLGFVAGLRPGTRTAEAIMTGSILGFSVPSFWVGIILIWLFSIELGWLPAIGRGQTADLFGVRSSLFTWNGLAHLSLPAFNLALTQIALVVRLTENGVREVMTSDFVRFARAQGLGYWTTVFKHVLPNVLLPVVTVLGLELGALLAYGLVTETVFAWPGLGKLLIDAINLLDRPVIVTYLTLTVLLFIVINLFVDLSYAMIDPRVKLYGRRP